MAIPPPWQVAESESGQRLAHFLASRTGLSHASARRIVDDGGVRVNGERVSDKSSRLDAGATYVLQVGKRRFAKVVLKKAN